MFTAKNYLNFAAAALMLAATASLTSCDNSFLYDDLPPCEVKHAVRFQFTNNMEEADAFSNKVHSIDLYVFDENDVFVKSFHEAGDILAMQGYTMALEGLDPGKYTLVVWGGMHNEGTRSESFEIVNDCVPGETKRRDLMCRMDREVRGDGSHHSSEKLFDLFHGTAYEVQIYSPDDTDFLGDHIYPINLTRDTNTVSILLQNLSGNEININDFYFQIEDDNGILTSDNSLGNDDVINYHECETFEGQAGVDIDTRGTRAIENINTGLANIRVSRLIESHNSYLTIRDGGPEGRQIARLPIIDYALLGKYADGGQLMTDQEYLDRQDSYKLTFFLDKQAGQWMTTQIYINSWALVESENNF